jgi:hypothetical protein
LYKIKEFLMGNTTTTLKSLTNLGSSGPIGVDDYFDDKLPDGDKYYGFVNVRHLIKLNLLTC